MVVRSETFLDLEGLIERVVEVRLLTVTNGEMRVHRIFLTLMAVEVFLSFE
jgi:hypothetical protein